MKDPWYGRADVLDPEQAALVEAACQSSEINALTYGAMLLRYLAVHSEPHDKQWRETHTICVAAFRGRCRKPDSFNLAAYLQKIQRCLDRFFEDEGSKYERRIIINFSEPGQKRNPNQYALDYPSNHGKGHYTRIFWREYLHTKVPTLITYGVPLFATDSKFETFSRNTLCNQEHELRDSGIACYPFVSHGEMLAMLEISKWLGIKNIKVIHKGYSHQHSVNDAFRDAADANGIFLGASRVNGVLRAYQRYLPFQFIAGDRAIEEYENGIDGRQIDTYADRSITEEDTVVAHALVSRRPGKRNRSTITMISSNHGVAIQRIGQLFTNESELKQLFESSVIPQGDLPGEFQLLFTVDILDKERGPGECRLIKAWFPTASKATRI